MQPCVLAFCSCAAGTSHPCQYTELSAWNRPSGLCLRNGGALNRTFSISSFSFGHNVNLLMEWKDL